MNEIYLNYIYERYLILKKSQKQEYDNIDLCKIFEYYVCIKLTKEFETQFYEYSTIPPEFKELNQLSQYDSGIDCCNLIDTIVQCKLRKKNLNWKECSTFFASQCIFDENIKKTIIKWPTLMIARNKDSKLSKNLELRRKLFLDKIYDKNELLSFCEKLIQNPQTYIETKYIQNDFKLRNYQIEAINLIKNNNENIIISLPTGSGKNLIILNSFIKNKKYLILVPKIILMDQLKNEIIKYDNQYIDKIQCIYNKSKFLNTKKDITICVYNSIHLIEKYCNVFEKIYIDEAHHVNVPDIYNFLNENLLLFEKKDKNYIDIIRSFVKYKNNVYLSATIDKCSDFLYYNKDIRTMIDLNYLCDYTITIPIFNKDSSNKNICKYLIEKYQNIIIYCKTRSEGIIINNLMNTLLSGCCGYIDCFTEKKDRINIIDEFKNGNISFIVNVKILVEGFDAPICKGVCFLHLPSDKTSVIQILGRCLRKHINKIIANVILPYSTDEDTENICKFLKIISKNDRRIYKTFEKKLLGGYINIDKYIDFSNPNIEADDDVEFKFNLIYNSFGECINFEEIWKLKLEKIKKFIDEFKRRPHCKSNNKYERNMGQWISNQQHNFKENHQIMKNINIFNLWNSFINDNKYFKFFETCEKKWNNMLQKVIIYIDINKKLPSTKNNSLEIRQLGQWLTDQKKNYKNKKKIMKNNNTQIIWENFITNIIYCKYFTTKNEIWFNKFEKLKNYIIENNIFPQIRSNKILHKWMSHQQYNFNKNIYCMKNKVIRDTWNEFINSDEYKKCI